MFAVQQQSQAQQEQQQQLDQPPDIYITEPDSNSSNSIGPPTYFQGYNMQQPDQQQFQLQQPLGTNSFSRPTTPLTVETQGLNIMGYDQSHSPIHSPGPCDIPLPPSPSPSSMMSDDENPYSPHSPISNSSMFRNVDGQQGPSGGYTLYNAM
jgi:hypothetical protein